MRECANLCFALTATIFHDHILNEAIIGLVALQQVGRMRHIDHFQAVEGYQTKEKQIEGHVHNVEVHSIGVPVEAV